jgi:carbonic anhydrase
MSCHADVFEANKRFAESHTSVDPSFFTNLSTDQSPGYLIVGCADSRVSPSLAGGFEPGTAFVVRNVANQVPVAAASSEDTSVTSAIVFGVKYLKVNHVVVCGHTCCGGVAAAMDPDGNLGPELEGWLTSLRALWRSHRDELDAIEDGKLRAERMVEINVLQGVRNLAKMDVIKEAVAERGLTVSGWVYGLEDGLLRDLEIDFEQVSQEVAEEA